MSMVSRTPYGVEPGAKLELLKESERFDPAVSGPPFCPSHAEDAG